MDIYTQSQRQITYPGCGVHACDHPEVDQHNSHAWSSETIYPAIVHAVRGVGAESDRAAEADDAVQERDQPEHLNEGHESNRYQELLRRGCIEK